jgi:V/A-type H+-transporting ATPase subunit K
LISGQVIQPTVAQGWGIFIACMPVAWAGFISAIQQGKVCTAGVYMIAKQPKESAKPLVMGALVETYAVLGLLATVLLLNGIKLP